MPADLAIVVITYDSEDMIDGLLDSIPAAVGEVSTRTIVVDNGSSDSTCARVLERADCELVRAENKGYAAGINEGIRRAPEVPAVLILNPDVRLHPGCVPPLMERATGDTGLVVPRVLNADGSLNRSLRREPTLPRALGLTGLGLPALSEYVTDPDDYTRPMAVDWALGAAMLLTQECAAVVGEWDESYFLYSEETDYCLRARDAGWTTRYEPESVVTHIGGQSGRNDNTHAMQIINRVRLYRRRHNVFAAWAYYALTVLSEVSWIARGHRQSRFAVRALLRPSLRPAPLGLGDRLLPG